jgi:hypothetical protein
MTPALVVKTTGGDMSEVELGEMLSYLWLGGLYSLFAVDRVAMTSPERSWAFEPVILMS